MRRRRFKTKGNPKSRRNKVTCAGSWSALRLRTLQKSAELLEGFNLKQASDARRVEIRERTLMELANFIFSATGWHYLHKARPEKSPFRRQKRREKRGERMVCADGRLAALL